MISLKEHLIKQHIKTAKNDFNITDLVYYVVSEYQKYNKEFVFDKKHLDKMLKDKTYTTFADYAVSLLFKCDNPQIPINIQQQICNIATNKISKNTDYNVKSPNGYVWCVTDKKRPEEIFVSISVKPNILLIVSRQIFDELVKNIDK